MMEGVCQYKTIERASEGLYKDKGSKFLAYAFPADDDERLRLHYREIREMHPKARHHCSGYRIGTSEIAEFAGDAGEPSGSAGLPILNQIRSAGITNCLIIVVRYFGGTKLGIPGLIQAYKAATLDALKNNSIVEREIMVAFQLEAAYSKLDKIYREVNKMSGCIDHQEIGNTGIFHVSIPVRNEKAFLKAMRSFIVENSE